LTNYKQLLDEAKRKARRSNRGRTDDFAVAFEYLPIMVQAIQDVKAKVALLKSLNDEIENQKSADAPNRDAAIAFLEALNLVRTRFEVASQNVTKLEQQEHNRRGTRVGTKSRRTVGS